MADNTRGRSNQAKPTKQEIRDYWKRLKRLAEQDNVLAIEAAIRLSEKEHP